MRTVLQKAMLFVPTALALFPYYIFAQTRAIPEKIVTCSGPDCTCENLIQMAQNLINAGIFIAVFLSAMLFAYAGWLYISNEAIGAQNKAREVFGNVAKGLVIILIAWLVVDTLMKQLLKDTIVWNNICSGLGL